MAGLFGNVSLGRRLEKAEVANAMELAHIYEQRHPGAAVTIETGGGMACFAGRSSPRAYGLDLGMEGLVSASDLDRLDSFYRERDAAFTIEACPLADPSLFDLLGRREYRITEFNNVLVRAID